MIYSNWFIGVLCVLNGTIVIPAWPQSHSVRTLELIDTILPSQKLFEDGNDPIGFRHLNQSNWVVGYNGGYLVEVNGESNTIDTLDCELTSFVTFQPDEYLMISLEGLFHFQSGVAHLLNTSLSGYPTTIHRNDQNSFSVLSSDGMVKRYAKKEDGTWSCVASKNRNIYVAAKDIVTFNSDTIILTYDTITWKSQILDSLNNQGLLPVDIFDIDGRDNQLYLLTPNYVCVIDMRTGELFLRPHGVVNPLDIYASADDLFGIMASNGEIYVFALSSP